MWYPYITLSEKNFSQLIIMSNTLGEQILKLIIDSIGKNPTSKAEAVALIAYILERDVLTLS